MNPFRPDFGRSPLVWSGRDELLGPYRKTMSQREWSISRSIVISGMRGTGKTVLLNEMEDFAQSQGWVVLRSDATNTAYDDMVYTTIPRAMEAYTLPTKKITAVSVAGVGSVQMDEDAADRPRPQLADSLRQLEMRVLERGAGLLITVDEAQHFDADFIHALANAVQLLNRDDLPVALVMAGLNEGVNELLSLPGTTFLRRARRYKLGPLTPAEARENFAETAGTTNTTFDPDALDAITSFSHGFPYLIQLAGWLSWERAHEQQTQITVDIVESITDRAIVELGNQVHAPQLRDLPAAQRKFLRAMAAVADDNQVAEIAAIAEHMGVTAKSLSTVRARLIEDELLVPVERGTLMMTMPYFANYLRGNGSVNTYW